MKKKKRVTIPRIERFEALRVLFHEYEKCVATFGSSQINRRDYVKQADHEFEQEQIRDRIYELLF